MMTLCVSRGFAVGWGWGGSHGFIIPRIGDSLGAEYISDHECIARQGSERHLKNQIPTPYFLGLQMNLNSMVAVIVGNARHLQITVQEAGEALPPTESQPAAASPCI